MMEKLKDKGMEAMREWTTAVEKGPRKALSMEREKVVMKDNRLANWMVMKRGK